MSAGFSLRLIVQQVLAENDSEDMDQLIKDVRARIPRKDTGAALDETLTQFVRAVMTAHRFSKPPVAGDAEGERAEDTHADPGADRDSAARTAHFSSYIERCLDERWAVQDGPARRLRDMTAADCAFNSARQKKIGRTHLARAAMFDSFHSALAEHGATVIGELPESFLTSMFRRAA